MSQFVNGTTSNIPNETKESNSKPLHHTLDGGNKSHGSSHVRHIPIYVEGRVEPVLSRFNDELDTAASFSNVRSSSNDIPRSGSIFSRVKEIPVKKFIPTFENSRRSASPARNIPIINQQHSQNMIPKQQQTPSQHNFNERSAQSPNKPLPNDPITKIQAIQNEMLDLMEKVEQFEGGSKKNKDYIYLDEMLTQNLLKLDTIDTEGKENIKAARKEVINCINKCIIVLEAKANGALQPNKT